ncbi:MAG: YigZ family protein [Bacteroidales bacterium]|nr:YigZ family protein [Bacteroidales bacterium]
MMSSAQTYKTLKSSCTGQYKEKGSKFLAFGFPASSEEAIKERLETMKKKFFDARHICYAYRLGPDGETWRANDSGEPSSTAGKPILGQLLSYDLTNVLMVVVRYFGGVKLGTGGLINAYRSAARDALEQAIIVEKRILETLELQFTYEQTDKVMRAIHDTGAQIVEQSYADGSLPCRLTVRVPPTERQTLLSAVNPNRN